MFALRGDNSLLLQPVSRAEKMARGRPAVAPAERHGPELSCQQGCLPPTLARLLTTRGTLADHGTEEERMVKTVSEIVRALVAAHDAGTDIDLNRSGPPRNALTEMGGLPEEC